MTSGTSRCPQDLLLLMSRAALQVQEGGAATAVAAATTGERAKSDRRSSWLARSTAVVEEVGGLRPRHQGDFDDGGLAKTDGNVLEGIRRREACVAMTGRSSHRRSSHTDECRH